MSRFILMFIIFSLFAVSVHALDNDRTASSATVTLPPPTVSMVPGQLTTLFASNNAYAGNMLDITPATTLTEITAIDVNVSSTGEALDIQVYYKLGTCVGYDTDPSAWTLLGTFNGTSAGQDNPSHIDMAGNGMSWNSGVLYGWYVHCENYPSISGSVRYTNAPSPQTYANADLSATCYYGKAHPAFGNTFTTRVWNGTIYYDTGEPTLTVTPSAIDMTVGGTATFELNAGPHNAGRSFGLFGSATGTSPGTPLPGGLEVMPINWDVYTDMLLTLAAMGHPYTPMLGSLDGNGKATVVLTFPAYPLAFPVATYYAFCLNNPFDFASEAVQLDLN